MTAFLSQLWKNRVAIYAAISAGLWAAQGAGWPMPQWACWIVVGVGAALGVHAGGQQIQARRLTRRCAAEIACDMHATTGCCAVVPNVLYRGPDPAGPNGCGMDYLQLKGIKTVIDLEYEGRDTVPLGMAMVSIPCHPWHPEDEDTLAFLQAATNPANQPCFVHCKQGVDRTGMMVAVYRMVVQGKTNDAAYSEMLAMGFHRSWWWWSIGAYVQRFNANLPKWSAFRKANP